MNTKNTNLVSSSLTLIHCCQFLMWGKLNINIPPPRTKQKDNSIAKVALLSKGMYWYKTKNLIMKLQSMQSCTSSKDRNKQAICTLYLAGYLHKIVKHWLQKAHLAFGEEPTNMAQVVQKIMNWNNLKFMQELSVSFKGMKKKTWFLARNITSLVMTPKGWNSWSKSFCNQRRKGLLIPENKNSNL